MSRNPALTYYDVSAPGAASTAPERGQPLARGAVMTHGMCSIDGCEGIALRRGWCTRHYQRWRKWGDPEGSRPPSPGYVTVNGYRKVPAAGHPVADRWGWAYEHRLVAWSAHGPFPLSRQVHHRNGDKLDNRPENLEVLAPAQHRAEHRQIDDAEMRRRYEAGESTTDLAAATGFNAAAIYRSILRGGGRIRSISEANRTAVDDEALSHLHALPGARVSNIAAGLGVSGAVVRRRMKELGLSSFPPGRPT